MTWSIGLDQICGELLEAEWAAMDLPGPKTLPTYSMAS